MRSIFAAAYDCLLLTDPAQKCTAVFHLKELVDESGEVDLNKTAIIDKIAIPGRPEKPKLVLPREVPRRSLATQPGRVALVHAITHIEFNAINLALDAMYRFQDQPVEYYHDWLHVAFEEAQHFSMLRERLKQLGSDYGDFSAHDGLWEMAIKTADSVVARMALVPRVLEARGLDVTPGMIVKLQNHGDEITANILKIIFEQEIGHVAIGSHWFNYVCKQQGLQPEETFQALLQEYFTGRLQGPFQIEARRKAGFSEIELEAMQNM